MALPWRGDLKAYMRIETAVEDRLLDRLLLEARANVEAYIRVPIVARPVTVTLEPTWVSGYGVVRRLTFPFAPIAGPVTVEEMDGEALLSSAYTVSLSTGRIAAAGTGVGFRADAYRVTATAGLSLRDDYPVAVEPVMGNAILDWAADLYQRRNPAASYESGAGGVATNYNETASKTMPSRIRVTLDPWRRVLV